MPRPTVDYKDLPLCPETGKISFPSRRLPPEYRDVGQRGHHIFISSYKCKVCPWWHQTKQR